ncbi:MAG: hypothetical protein O7D96_05390, partial [SAR324 cluster bacterium]|nr:hypothetical protein [SAR324 cluster bacterium]
MPNLHPLRTLLARTAWGLLLPLLPLLLLLLLLGPVRAPAQTQADPERGAALRQVPRVTAERGMVVAANP